MRRISVLAMALGLFAPSAAEAGHDVYQNVPVIILVAPPTGDAVQDRASIEASISRAQPGDVVRFAPGRYVIGIEQPSPAIDVPVANVTLLGSAQGTTIFGGEVTQSDEPLDGFRFNRGGATVRRLRFESFVRALLMGEDRPDLGGYIVEQNVFKNVFDASFLTLHSAEVTSIAHNEYVNVGVPFDLAGGVLHFTNNFNHAPDPGSVPVFGRPLTAGTVFAFPDFPCRENVFEGNTMSRLPDGFGLVAAGGQCRRNVIRNNTFLNQTRYAEFDSGTMAFLLAFGGGVIDNVLVEGNRLDATEGVGILLLRASNSTITGNLIRGTRRAPGLDPPFGGPGGIGILLAAESRGNAIASNRLLDNERCDVVLRAAARNNVVVEPDDTVLDRGENNQVVRGAPCGMEGTAGELAEAQLGASPKLQMLLELRGR